MLGSFLLIQLLIGIPGMALFQVMDKLPNIYRYYLSLASFLAFGFLALLWVLNVPVEWRQRCTSILLILLVAALLVVVYIQAQPR